MVNVSFLGEELVIFGEGMLRYLLAAITFLTAGQFFDHMTRKSTNVP